MKIKWLKIVQVGLTILILIVSRVGVISSGGQLRFFFLNVGQGDALLILTPENISILIDTGPDISVVSGLGKYLSNRKIDYLIITHPDKDHSGGLSDILSSYVVLNYIGEKSTLTSNLKLYNSIISGDELNLGCCVNFHFYNLNNPSQDTNERSIAVLVHMGALSLFAAGDLPSKLEDQLAPVIGHIDILKVGHHGSNTSTDDYFLNEIKPEIAVISVGKNNKYGHPKSVTLGRLKAIKATILRTDEVGDVNLTTDGQSVQQIPQLGFLW